MEEDLQCNSITGIDLTNIKLPDPHSINSAELASFTSKIEAAAEIYGEEGAVLYQPDNTDLIKKSTETQDSYLSLLGEDRFTGLDLKRYMYARYFVADIDSTSVDVVNFQTPTAITLCDEEGNPYNVTVPLANKYFDSNKKQVQFPLFDSRGQQVTLPLFDTQGRFILTEALTAIDAVGNNISFPLSNIYREYVKFPVRDINGSILTKPPKPSTILQNISAAQLEINNLYDLSKDRHANLFIDYLLEQQNSYDIGLFHGKINMNIINNSKIPDVNYFIVGFFTKGSSTTELESSNLAYYAKYYPDRVDFVETNFAARGGIFTSNNYDADFS